MIDSTPLMASKPTTSTSLAATGQDDRPAVDDETVTTTVPLGADTDGTVHLPDVDENPSVPAGDGTIEGMAEPAVQDDGTDAPDCDTADIAPVTNEAPAAQDEGIAYEEQAECYEGWTWEEQPSDPQPQAEQPIPSDPSPAGEVVTYWTYPEIPAPVAGDGGMTGDELTLAHEVFDLYNEWRAAHGLGTVVWDGTCAEMAVASAHACSDRHNLEHRLGIPTDVQDRYVDILQFASWRLDASEVISNWDGSDGHRRMMLCPTVQSGACGVYQEGGFYWFAIVYSFQGNACG